MLSFDFILGWNFVFCFFKFIILHYFYPKIKENIIQIKNTFEPQLVRGQKRAFEMREIHECKGRHQTLFTSGRPKSPSFNSCWIRPGYGVEKGSFLFTCQLFLRDVCFHHILPWLSKNVSEVPSITEDVPKTSEGCQKTTKTSKSCKRWKRPKNETPKQQN